jgi:bifunctional UDP-N-acetylglucosamine pyrophosphorylase/glucosamine-1-phosphate N-acetyltransferase
MSENNFAVVVLAAGRGIRMKSDVPKVLHQVGGRAMLRLVLDAVEPLQPDRIVVVVGSNMPAVEEMAAPHISVVQDPPLGTGHAVLQAASVLDGYHGVTGHGEVLVVFGDTPLLSTETLETMREARREGEGAPSLVGLGFRPGDPGQYGRLVLDETGRVQRIVEFADADPAEREIDLCNGGVLLADAPLLFALLGRCGQDNAKGEIYLTDVFELAYQMGLDGRIIETAPEEILGVNSRADQAIVETVFQTRLRGRAMAEGSSLIDPSTVWLSADTRIGQDVTIEPFVFIGPGVSLGDGVTLRAFSHIEGASIAAGAEIGPFARIRPETVIGAGAKIGNFVEVKNSTLASGAKANHLSYVGDTEVGERANIGAGTITANYDGFSKHRTRIGAGASIGSNSVLVAPVSVGDGAIVGASSAITEDVSPDALALERGEQREHAGGARRFRERRDRPPEIEAESSGDGNENEI